MDKHAGPYIDPREYGNDDDDDTLWCHRDPCHESYCAHRDTCPADIAYFAAHADTNGDSPADLSRAAACPDSDSTASG